MAKKKPARTKGAAKAALQPATPWQWEAVEFWRGVLKENARKPPPGAADARWSERDVRDGSDAQNIALARMAESWGHVENELPPGLRKPGPHIGTFPLAALCVYIEMGHLPPPELLLGVMESFNRYMDAKGAVSLEEVFFGKPLRRAGNYAARSAASLREAMWATEIAVRAADGASDIKAAEALVEQRKLTIDPESVLRIARRRFSRVKPDK